MRTLLLVIFHMTLLRAADSSIGGFPDGILFNGEYNSAISYDDISSHEPLSPPRIDFGYQPQLQLIPGMWGTEHYEVPEYTHDPAQLTPLTIEAVTNPFFEQLRNAPQKVKNSVLITAVRSSGGDKGYLARRTNMLAAFAAGAEYPTIIPAIGIVHQAALHQDHHLLEWLLGTYHCNVHEQDIYQETPILHSRTVATAQVLIKYGALNNTAAIKQLPFTALQSDRDPRLITLYQDEHRLSFWQVDRDGHIPLDMLRIFPDQHVVTRAALLFRGKSLEDCRRHLGNDCFNRLERTLRYDSLLRYEIVQLKALSNFLHILKESGMPPCGLCKTLADSKAIKIMACTHIIHEDCMQQHTSCPLCSQETSL